MSRRTAVIPAALLLLIGARMPVWRAAQAVPPAAKAGGGDDPAHDWNVERTAWQLAPALSHRLGLVLVLEGS